MLKKTNVFSAERLKAVKKSIRTLLSCEAVSDFKNELKKMDKEFLDMLSSFFLFLASLGCIAVIVFCYFILGGLL